MANATTPLGEIKGIDRDGCELFAGIRYAQPPTGEGRFRAPEPIEAWTGVYDATAFGPASPQPIPDIGAVGVRRGQRTDEDCLYLNVYTPRADDGKRPVMVWIHGGAYTMGSGDFYDGTRFARDGDVVVVTLNYRLGVLGWTGLDHLDPALAGSGNNGLRDQIEALRWVRANVASFGGDPDNVTVFGESAGGGSVFALLAAPAADGLFHKAIAQSGVPGFGPPDRSHSYVDRLLAALGAPDGGIEVLRSATAEQLMVAQATIGLFDHLGDDEYHFESPTPGPHPVIDGVVITRSVVDAVRERGAANVPLLIGTNQDEGTLFTTLLPRGLDDTTLLRSLAQAVDNPQQVLEMIRARAGGRDPVVELMTDAVFRIPSLHVADAAAEVGVPTWVYLFTWRTPIFGGMLGATHALELPFVWNLIGDPMWAMFTGPDAPRALATAMHSRWLSFARTGDPNADADGPPEWPRYDTAARPTMVFGDEVRIESDPGGDSRRVWYGA